MQKGKILSLILIVILLVTTVSLLLTSQPAQSKEQVYVGVAFGGTTVEQAKILIDRVKSYTNLFVLASGLNPISSNQSAVEEICDYAIATGLNIIVNLGTRTSEEDWAWKLEFYKTASDRYGEKYLGHITMMNQVVSPLTGTGKNTSLGMTAFFSQEPTL